MDLTIGYAFWVKNDYNFSYENYLQKSIEEYTQKKMSQDNTIQIINQKKVLEVGLLIKGNAVLG